MIQFEDYKDRYKFARLERRDGIMQVTLHSKGDSLIWGARPHEELVHVFQDIANDRANKVVILTGTGEAFIDAFREGQVDHIGPEDWDPVLSEGRRLLTNLLDIEVPMIAAVNGPATIHAELALLCDIVLAADHAVFQDAPHFMSGLVPGDGVHIVWPLLLGMNRGRYFLLTGQRIGAAEALDLGLVGEVLPRADLLARAWTLAEELAQQPPLTLRYARSVLTMQLKKLMLDHLGHGLALEGLAAGAYWPRWKP